MKKYFLINTFLILIASAIILPGCTKKLDLSPSNNVTNATLFTSVDGYKSALAKLYLSMSTIGSNGSSGTGDLPSQIITDAGSSDFLRNFWYLQCLSTDEAGWAWSGNTDPVNIHEMAWSSDNFTVKCMYYRLFYTITLCNNFVIESSPSNLSSRGLSATDTAKINEFKQEARFLRAYNYWALMDLYGNPPFVTDSTTIGTTVAPKQIQRKDLFNYIESELKSIANALPDPKANEYGRVDKAAAWALLARLYLNAEVYTGTARYTDAITYCNKVIAAGYTLHSKYKELFLADNNLNTDEFIWTLNYDGTYTQNYGGTTFLVHAPAGYSADSSGLSGSWNCIHVPQQFVALFDNQDIRGQFWTGGQQLNMTYLLQSGAPSGVNAYNYGYSSSKFRNKTRSGGLAPHVDVGKTYADIDMPLFRLAEIYLIYAEAVVRGGTGGSSATALGYLQQLAVRARPNDASATSYPSLTLAYILNERARELFWEGFRRTDLIRYNQFTTGTYLWAWKGGIINGTSVDSKYNLYPIPSNDLTANLNLKQNTGY